MIQITAAKLPTSVTIGGQKIRGSEVKDLLLDAPIVEVRRPGMSKTNNPYAIAVAHDRETGQIINIIGFDDMADTITGLRTQKAYSFAGEAGYARGKKIFRVHRLIEDSVFEGQAEGDGSEAGDFGGM